MSECHCKTVWMYDVETVTGEDEHRTLRHSICGRKFDPALRVICDNQNQPHSPHVPNVEYRVWEDDGGS